MKLTYKNTLVSCYICFLVQSIINNFSPLLFVTYSREFNISLDQITILITYNFLVQLLVDIVGVKFAHRIGHRRGMLIAHFTSFIGMSGLAVFTKIMPPYIGLIVATTFCALGSGTIEVMASPVVEALPLENKSSAMSLTHSAYCWGHIAIVLISTLYFAVAGVENWRFLAIFWSLIPFVNGMMFAFVPIAPLAGDNSGQGSFLRMFKLKNFPLFMILNVNSICMSTSVHNTSIYFVI